MKPVSERRPITLWAVGLVKPVWRMISLIEIGLLSVTTASIIDRAFPVTPRPANCSWRLQVSFSSGSISWLLLSTESVIFLFFILRLTVIYYGSYYVLLEKEINCLTKRDKSLPRARIFIRYD